ncbi:MAG: hypothetical protein JNM99_14370 [Verrucomicrobiaceae bacterium]|nr:hypothetical protein [Verrucomicrobiaceae bacterium]
MNKTLTSEATRPAPKDIDWALRAELTEKAVKEAIAELQAITASNDPIELLSRVAVYILTSHPESPKDAGGPQQSETNLEYLVSFVTAHPASQVKGIPSPDVVQHTLELVTALLMAATWHYSSKRRAKQNAENAIDDIANSFQLDKLHVRGDGYWPHLKQTIQDLMQPHEAHLKKVLGFTAAEYINFMERTEDGLNLGLLNEAETHCEPFMAMYRPWFRNGTTNDDQFDDEGWKQSVDAHTTEVAEAKAKLDAYGSAKHFRFQATSQAEKCILEALSCEIGSNTIFHGTKPEHAFWPLTPSATDARPIVCHEGEFYGFNLSKLSREAYTLIGDLLRRSDPGYWGTTFNKQRDNYLETETAKLLQKALPSAKVLRTVFYPFGHNEMTEADIIVLCDDVLIVVECKALRVDPASKRGANKKIESDLGEAIVKAFNQAERFVRELTSRGTMELSPKSGPKISVSTQQFERVFSINVTLDLINPVSTTLWKLAEAGLASGIEKCWSVSLNDLRVIVEILDQPALFLHYLVRRLDLNLLRRVESKDELDFLMHYVKHGLFFQEVNSPAQDEHVMLAGFTEELDQYYRKVQGISHVGEKPRVPIGKQTQKLLTRLQSETPEHWASGCIELLNFDTPTCEELLHKQPSHLKQLQHPRSGYALSFVANFESGAALALATSKEPLRAQEIVMGRCAEHCRQHNLATMCCFLHGVPISGIDIRIFHVTPETQISDHASRLLDQLRLEIHVTENRITGQPS